MSSTLDELDEQQAGKPARRLRGRLLEREVIGPPRCPIMHRWTVVAIGRRAHRPEGEPPWSAWELTILGRRLIKLAVRDDDVDRSRKLLVHRFLPNADDRSEHDHPAGFLTIVLAGGYDDRVPYPRCDGLMHIAGAPGRRKSRPWGATGPCPTCNNAGDVIGDRMRAGMVRYRPATYRHRTRVLPAGAWTLVLMRRKSRPWGFWNAGRWWPWREHEQAFGFGMRCPDEDRP